MYLIINFFIINYHNVDEINLYRFIQREKVDFQLYCNYSREKNIKDSIIKHIKFRAGRECTPRKKTQLDNGLSHKIYGNNTCKILYQELLFSERKDWVGSYKGGRSFFQLRSQCHIPKARTNSDYWLYALLRFAHPSPYYIPLCLCRQVGLYVWQQPHVVVESSIWQPKEDRISEFGGRIKHLATTRGQNMPWQRIWW